MLKLADLQKLWPHGNQHVPGLLEGVAEAAPEAFPKWGFTSDLLIAHAMAQFSEECGAGLEMEENMNYSAGRLMQVWPSRFGPSLAAKAAHNPRMVADIAYGGRMGNRPYPSDDGYNYRGRGFSQVTGREGYAALAEKTGLDVLAHPELLSDPDHALELGLADLIICGCLPYMKRDDVVGATRRLNGGYNGLAERRRWLALWKHQLGVK